MTVTVAGFERARLPEIKADIDAQMADALGAVNTNADSVIGQLDGIWAEAVSDINETLQDVYDSAYVSSAEGVSLDNDVALVGMERLAATATAVTAAAYGNEGDVIPVGTLSHTDINYTSTSEVVISRANAIDVEIKVTSVLNNTVYSILAGGQSFTFTSSSTATEANILAGLAALMNADPLKTTVSSGVLRVTAYDGVTPFSITVDTKLSITKRGSPVVFVASVKGAYVVPIGALNVFDTAVPQGCTLYNLVAGETGREVETDTELRLRHLNSPRVLGSATPEAIKARLLAAGIGITSARVYENRTNITSNDGIPAHAYETVIIGGVQSQIAQLLWETKPAGIETYGNISTTVIDTSGDAQVVKFSRPVAKFGWVNVVVNALDTEEVLPTAAAQAIKDAVVAYAEANFGVGDDVITQRFYGAIYSAVSGIAKMTITAAITNSAGDTPAYTADNIAIAKAERSEFAQSRVIVSGLV
jgi:uncharacterized phage protein gp47/JayE